MKKLILLFTLLFVITLNAQEQPQETPLVNEIKLNVGYSLLAVPEFSFERILNEESSVGISLAVSIDNDVDLNYILTPYYRFFFGKKHAAGFFIEGNAAVFSEQYNFKNETGFGLGIAVGGKFLSKRNWIGELHLGLGRTLINEDKIAEAYPRVGISIGKRF
ncbi:MAG: DUF3575 domain-containing protein [Flavobacteriaceae bacterium]|nr:DUF3575 domain-containing protein [Flavobacteriaceae bacterium]